MKEKRWVKNEKGKAGNCYECPDCHEEYRLTEGPIGKGNYNYCPNCGIRLMPSEEEAKDETCSCGGEGQIMYIPGTVKKYVVTCIKCGKQTDYYPSEAEATLAWNRGKTHAHKG